jgi:hypothetical protein
MSRFDDIQAEQKATERKSKSIEKRMEKFRSDILAGKDSTGNPMKDFMFVNFGLDEKRERAIHTITDHLSGADAIGTPVLIKDEFHYQKDAVICHGFGGKPEYNPYALFLLRFGVISDKPTWSVEGLTLPMEHYAFAIQESEFLYAPHWDAHSSSIQLTKAELVDQIFFFGQSEERIDIPPAFWEEYQKGPSHYRSKLGSYRLEALVGDAVTERCAEWDKVNHAHGNERHSYDEALFIVDSGMTQKEYAQNMESMREKRRKELFTEILVADKIEMLELLEEAIGLDMHNKPGQYNKERGVTIDIPDFVKARCDDLGVKYQK